MSMRVNATPSPVIHIEEDESFKDHLAAVVAVVAFMLILDKKEAQPGEILFDGVRIMGPVAGAVLAHKCKRCWRSVFGRMQKEDCPPRYVTFQEDGDWTLCNTGGAKPRQSGGNP